MISLLWLRKHDDKFRVPKALLSRKLRAYVLCSEKVFFSWGGGEAVYGRELSAAKRRYSDKMCRREAAVFGKLSVFLITQVPKHDHKF